MQDNDPDSANSRRNTDTDNAALSERVARLEGLLEGLRDAITAKAA